MTAFTNGAPIITSFFCPDTSAKAKDSRIFAQRSTRYPTSSMVVGVGRQPSPSDPPMLPTAVNFVRCLSDALDKESANNVWQPSTHSVTKIEPFWVRSRLEL